MQLHWDFPRGPLVKTLPFNAGGAGSIPAWKARSHLACGQKKQSIKQKQYCNKLNEDFKMFHIKKIFKKEIQLYFKYLVGFFFLFKILFI